ncbi:MAG: septation protein IspZ [Proteobacteria bacterium]|nr:septation protein IspZ [Pseudomonadota bacterium]
MNFDEFGHARIVGVCMVFLQLFAAIIPSLPTTAIYPMQLLVDFLPIVLFFAAYVMSNDFFVALVVLMVAAPFAMGIQWLLTKKINKISTVSTALVIVLGGGALLLDNKMIFLWKPTVFYWVAAVVFLASQFVGERPIIQRIMESASKDADAPVQLVREQWTILNLSWVIFFIVGGALNIYVAYNYPEATWVKFKLFGLLGLTLAFVIAQSFWLARYMDSKPSE